MKAPNRTSQGFSLIELMIAMLLGLIVMAGVFSIFGQTLRNNRDIIGSARLNQDLGTIATIMANDIRRAGYSGGGLPVYGGGDPGTNAAPRWFNARNADLNILPDGNGNPSCILYSYNLNLDNPDLNNSGAVDAADKTINDNVAGSAANPVIDSGERFGFRLNTNAGTISMRRSCDPYAATGATPPGGGGDAADPTNDCYDTCTAGTWEEITDPNVIEITELTFTTVGSRCMMDGARSYWTVKDPNATPTVYTDDPYSFPCDNHTTLFTTATKRTDLTEVDFMVLSGTPPVYGASTTSSVWSDAQLLIPQSLAWAVANPQVLATTATHWDSAVETREINIHLRGRLTSDNAVIKETHTQIKVGNNRVFVAPTPI